jgi:RNA polymerase sigma-70 factor (sigma-E family)
MEFEAFAREHRLRLVRVSANLTNDRGLGEDLVQDVLLRVQQRWSVIAELDEPYSYVRRMLVNEFISWRRKWARIQPHPEVVALRDGLPSALDDEAQQRAERDALLGQIARLPRRQRAVIVLRYYEDLSDQVIAGVLGCSASTVRGYAMRALRTLRVQAADAAEDDDSDENDNLPVGSGNR